jgi:hypothetical protein
MEVAQQAGETSPMDSCQAHWQRLARGCCGNPGTPKLIAYKTNGFVHCSGGSTFKVTATFLITISDVRNLSMATAVAFWFLNLTIPIRKGAAKKS